MAELSSGWLGDSANGQMSNLSSPVVAVVQARMTSTRLPGKVLMQLAGEPLIRRVVERVQRIAGVDRVVVALAQGPEHDDVEPALDGADVLVVRGSETDVLARTAAAARAADAVTVMRITSDCPMIDPAVSASILAAYAAGQGAGIRYARTGFDTGFPLGFDTEVLPAQALYEAEVQASDPYEREHVTPYIWRRPERFPATILAAQPDRRHWRLVVDTKDDYRLAAAIYECLHGDTPEFGYMELCALFEARPDLLEINAHVRQNVYADRC
jgi:spore coat polysaccharide biosynthesis protein SpsF